MTTLLRNLPGINNLPRELTPSFSIFFESLKFVNEWTILEFFHFRLWQLSIDYCLLVFFFDLQDANFELDLLYGSERVLYTKVINQVIKVVGNKGVQIYGETDRLQLLFSHYQNC